jgi:RHS repeat-associated protein
VQGALTEPASVTVNGVPARVDANNQFEGSAAVKSGTNQFEVAATDGNGNTATQRYQVNVPAASSIAEDYDFNGNLTRKTEAGRPVTYEWDAANRLTAINNGTERSEFSYDGLDRRVRILEMESGIPVSDKRFVWSGVRPVEERDTANNALGRYFAEGEQRTVASGATANFYYMLDHLGSIQEMTDASGAVRAAYAYEPFGNRTKLSGDLDVDFGYTGHYRHVRSGLNLAPYRAYDSATGRWISRDPIAEDGGLNMYGYVGNSPTNRSDPLGLWYALIPGSWFDGNGFEGSGSNFFRGRDFDEGAYAGLDGLIPFADPFARNGFYNDCDEALQWSHGLGQVSQGALFSALGGTASKGLQFATGGMKQWLRIGASYSRASGEEVSMSVRWGASPRYANRIGSEWLRNLNPSLRGKQLPGSTWRTADPGHFHVWK